MFFFLGGFPKYASRADRAMLFYLLFILSFHNRLHHTEGPQKIFQDPGFGIFEGRNSGF